MSRCCSTRRCLFLRPERGGTYVDCTLGLGGHTRALLAPRRDARHRDRPRRQALEARGTPGDRRRSRRAGARGLPRADGGARERGIDGGGRHPRRSRGVVAAVRQRGARVQLQAGRAAGHADGPSAGTTAADLVNAATETELADVIFRYGEERTVAPHRARDRGAAGRSRRRASWPRMVRRAVPTRGWQRIDPATRTFQAIRIWVNGELDGLDASCRTRPRGWRRRRGSRDLVSLARGSHRQAHDARRWRSAARDCRC